MSTPNPDTQDSSELRDKLRQDIRDMFKMEGVRNELIYALEGEEIAPITLQDYEDDLSLAIANWFYHDLLPAEVLKALDSIKLPKSDPTRQQGFTLEHGITIGMNKANLLCEQAINQVRKAYES